MSGTECNGSVVPYQQTTADHARLTLQPAQRCSLRARGAKPMA